MPAPLLLIGAAVASAYTLKQANTTYVKRKTMVESMPGESCHKTVPVNGSVVSCGIYGILEHTGIWVNGNIYELAGTGLVRCVSPQRFIQARSGSQIYIACDPHNKALFDNQAAQRAKDLLYCLLNYHVLDQNCHRFVAETLSNQIVDITSFSELNTFLYSFFKSPIRWNLTQINFR